MSNVSPLMLLQLFKRLGIGALYGAGFAAGAIAILAAVLGGIGQFSLRTEPRSTSLTPAASDFRDVASLFEMCHFGHHRRFRLCQGST
jgi:hypothetical protein